MAPETPLESSESSFPVLTVSIIGILATSIILLSYYLFVTKCCLNLQHFRIISSISSSHLRRRGREDILASHSSILDVNGLQECEIQSIPNFRYKRSRFQCSFYECSVCLNEFREEERIRMLPNCFHVFHIDCIDTWLQTHKNCPICRSEIKTTSPTLTNEIKKGTFSQNSAEGENLAAEARRRELRFEARDERKRTTHVSSMGDECIDMRGERGEFGVQPMRRSFSLDSSKDRLLCIAVQEILQNGRDLQDLRNGEGSSNGSSGKVRRSFFPFSHSRSSKSAVLPVQN
ncbi:RING-H2 finger protein ATL16-like [Phalaenopsis equestris]|uniref:RING-H2 finger protein ATL16-like n=1 Tax=Phalaenopsis equestris TaxID=78828 RepID=UPI0009E6542F|nr:RING-H2 finger protein ATL16-like [Phalaenopsis equestris]